MEIRRVRPEEWETIRALRLRALATDPEAFGEVLADVEQRPESAWTTWIVDPTRAIFVAVNPDAGGESGALVAMAVGAPMRDNPEIAGLFGMWVAPEVREQGIGAALVESVLDWARTGGFGTIQLGVETTHAAAIRLYAGRGFTDTGERHSLRPDSNLTYQTMIRRLLVEEI